MKRRLGKKTVEELMEALEDALSIRQSLLQQDGVNYSVIKMLDVDIRKIEAELKRRARRS